MRKSANGIRGRHMVTLLMAAHQIIACGGSLNDGEYQGDPMLVLRGEITSLEAVTGPQPTYVGVEWWFDGEEGDEFVLQNTEITRAMFPASFELALYDPLPDWMLTDLANTDPEDGAYVDPEDDWYVAGMQGKIAMGYILAYQDIDNDGTLTFSMEEDGEADRVRGIAPRRMLLYVEGLNDEGRLAMLRAGHFDNPEDLVDGYNLLVTRCTDEIDDFGRPTIRMRAVRDEPVVIESTSTVFAESPSFAKAACLPE